MSNLFLQLQALIPRASQSIAVVQVENADGTSTCLTLDAQVIRVKGVNNRAVGAKVFVVIDPVLGASIIGDAPDLEGYVVDI